MLQANGKLPNPSIDSPPPKATMRSAALVVLGLAVGASAIKKVGGERALLQ